MKRLLLIGTMALSTVGIITHVVSVAGNNITRGVSPQVEEHFIKSLGHRTTQGIIDTGCAKEVWMASKTQVWTDNYCYRTYNHLLEKL